MCHSNFCSPMQVCYSDITSSNKRENVWQMFACQLFVFLLLFPHDTASNCLLERTLDAPDPMLSRKHCHYSCWLSHTDGPVLAAKFLGQRPIHIDAF